MKAGMVVSIRVNPKDCQSVLDLMESVGIKIGGQSFSQLCALAFSSLLEGARLQGAIPEPDAYQYLNRMGQYHKGKMTSRKHAIAQTVYGAGTEFRAPTLQGRQEEELPEHLRPTAEQLRAGSRLKELLVKQEFAADSWSTEDQKEHDELMKIVYPHG